MSCVAIPPKPDVGLPVDHVPNAEPSRPRILKKTVFWSSQTFQTSSRKRDWSSPTASFWLQRHAKLFFGIHCSSVCLWRSIFSLVRHKLLLRFASRRSTQRGCAACQHLC